MKKLDCKDAIYRFMEGHVVGTINITDELKVSVMGSVFMMNSRMRTLPVRFGEVTENFFMYESSFTSLTNAPHTVGGTMLCCECKLTSLEGAPRTVGKNFNCFNNQLTRLEGAPAFLGNNFHCHANPISELNGFNTRFGNRLTVPPGIAELESFPLQQLDTFDCRILTSDDLGAVREKRLLDRVVQSAPGRHATGKYKV